MIPTLQPSILYFGFIIGKQLSLLFPVSSTQAIIVNFCLCFMRLLVRRPIGSHQRIRELAMTIRLLNLNDINNKNLQSN